MTDRYAVIGNPVSHSKSPFIHSSFAEATGQDLTYVAIEAPLGGFASASTNSAAKAAAASTSPSPSSSTLSPTPPRVPSARAEPAPSMR